MKRETPLKAGFVVIEGATKSLRITCPRRLKLEGGCSKSREKTRAVGACNASTAVKNSEMG
jgi:hypothetical protein